MPDRSATTPLYWTCRDCGGAGRVDAPDTAPLARALGEAENQHAERAPWCPWRRDRLVLSLFAPVAVDG